MKRETDFAPSCISHLPAWLDVLSGNNPIRFDTIRYANREMETCQNNHLLDYFQLSHFAVLFTNITKITSSSLPSSVIISSNVQLLGFLLQLQNSICAIVEIC